MARPNPNQNWDWLRERYSKAVWGVCVCVRLSGRVMRGNIIMKELLVQIGNLQYRAAAADQGYWFFREEDRSKQG